MPTYKEIFERIPSVSELSDIKQDLKDEKGFTSWEDHYWAVKNICVYDSDPCDTELIVKNINLALEKGLNVKDEIRTYFDAVKILATLYSQSGDYERTIECLDSLLGLDVSIPDWVYHYEVMAEIKTYRIAEILKNPYGFLDKLSKNSKNSSAITRRQRNIFRQFLVEAERYIQLNENVDIDLYALTETATRYGLDKTEGWRLFTSTIPGSEYTVSGETDEISIPKEKPDEEHEISTKLQSVLFGDEIQSTTNRMLEQKYADVIKKLEKLEKEMELKRQELEENAASLEKLNQENEVLIYHAREDKEKREALLIKIQHQQEENKALKEEIDKVKEIKQSELEKVKKDPHDEIVGNVHLYLYSAQLGLETWLQRYLPKSTGDWWRRAVLDSLSYEQRERAQEQNYTTLAQFDLAALLRIMSRNWRRITQIVYLSQGEYDCLQEMFNIRNRWSHMNTNLPSTEDIRFDLETIADFMSLVGCSKQSINEVKTFSSTLV